MQLYIYTALELDGLLLWWKFITQFYNTMSLAECVKKWVLKKVERAKSWESAAGISGAGESLSLSHCCDSTLIENDEIPIQMVMKYLGNPIKIK